MKKSYRLEPHTSTIMNVFHMEGTMMGYVEKTSATHQTEWVAFEPGGIGFDHRFCDTPQRAAYCLAERIRKRKKKQKVN